MKTHETSRRLCMAVAAAFALTHCTMADVVTNDVSDVVSLTNALKNATDGCVIRMAKGVYDVSSLSDDQAPMSTSSYGHSLLVLGKADMQLVGATGNPEDVVIKAVNSNYRMFNLSGARSMMRDVTIMGGNASAAHITVSANYRSGGGVLFIADSASVSNCVFTGNKAAARGGAVAGAFNNRYGTVYDSVFYGNNDQSAESMACDRTTIRGCTFTNNVAASSANTICLVTNSRVYDSTFANNKTPTSCVFGGGTYASIVDGCRFLNNTTTYGSGAAVRLSTVSNSYFYGNVAPSSGGAIYGGTVSFCTVVSNRTDLIAVSGKTTPYGGGIYKATLVEGCLVASNVCHSGGGLSDCTLVRDTTNVYNTATYGGGAYNSALERCVVSHNVARGMGLDMNVGGGGAGLYGGSATNCVFRDNSCSATLASTSLYGCEIADTSFGADSVEFCVIHGLRNDPRPRAIGNVCYPGGHVASNLYMIGIGGLMRNCLVTNCTWQSLGGIYVNSAVFYPTASASTSRVENCTFVDNNYYYLSRNVSSSKACMLVNAVFIAGDTPNSLGDIRDFTKNGSCLVLSNCVCGVAMRGDVTKAAGFEDGWFEEIGSIANARFVGTGDYPLTPGRGSPLRGSGLVLDWMASGFDLAWQPRLSDGGVDIGCYQHVPGKKFMIIFY